MNIMQLVSTLVLALFPGLPVFCSSVFVQYNTWKWKSAEKQGRPGNTYHVNDVRWTQGGRRGGEVRTRSIARQDPRHSQDHEYSA